MSDTHRKALENEVKSYKNDVAAIKEDIARLQENQEEDEFLKQMQDAISTLLPSPPQPASSPPPTPTSPRSSRHDADILRMKEHLTLPHWTSKELVDTEIARLVEAKNATRIHVQSPAQSPNKRHRREDEVEHTGADTGESHPNRKRRRHATEQSSLSVLVETGGNDVSSPERNSIALRSKATARSTNGKASPKAFGKA